MRKASFAKKILSRDARLRSTGDYFYFTPVAHVLSGFSYERRTGGIYVLRFLYPLFDDMEFVHLTYSDRLPYPECVVDFDEVDRKDLADEFCRRIDPYVDEALKLRELDGFTQHVEKKFKEIELARVDYILGLSYVIQGRYEEARLSIERSLPELDESLHDTASQVLGFLASNSQEKAKDLIHRIERKVANKLGISVE